MCMVCAAMFALITFGALIFVLIEANKFFSGWIGYLEDLAESTDLTNVDKFVRDNTMLFLGAAREFVSSKVFRSSAKSWFKSDWEVDPNSIAALLASVVTLEYEIQTSCGNRTVEVTYEDVPEMDNVTWVAALDDVNLGSVATLLSYFDTFFGGDGLNATDTWVDYIGNVGEYIMNGTVPETLEDDLDSMDEFIVATAINSTNYVLGDYM